MEAESRPVPEGFELLEDASPFHQGFSPVYHKRKARGAIIGMQVREHHLNRYGRLHGGALAGFLDFALGISILLQPGMSAGNFTVSLTIDFMDAGWSGEWLEARVSIPKLGKRLAFAHCEVSCDGRPIARGSGVWSLKTPDAATGLVQA